LSSSLLGGYVNPRGAPTSYYFEYGATSAYGSQTPTGSAGSGSSEVKVSASIAGLVAGTTYHFRLVAVSPVGTTAGPDHVFTTTSIPLSFQLSTLSSPLSAGSSFVIEGTLLGSNSAGREVELQMNQFPYSFGMTRLGSPVLTDASGHFSFSGISLLENARLRVATVAVPRVSSPAILAQVAVRVVLHARRMRSHRRGRLYRLYGSVTPADVGAHVLFKLLRPHGRTVTVAGTRIKRGGSTSSRFSAVVRIRHAGLYETLVTVTNGRNVSGYSAPVRIR
jgi:hypothetical protein